MRDMRRSIAAVVLTAGVLVVVPGVAQATTPPSLAWSPTTSSGTYDFGTTTVGQTASETFTLTNSGGNATSALTITVTGSAAFSVTADTCTATSLGPRKSCAVVVAFAPASPGTDTATLTAVSKKTAATAMLALTGIAVPSASAAFVPANEPTAQTTGTVVVGGPAGTYEPSSGNPVEVEVLDGHGNVETGFTGPVTVSIAAGTGSAGAVLGGTTTQNAVAGIASFNNLTVNLSGAYQLTATASDVASALSALFPIYTTFVSCAAGATNCVSDAVAADGTVSGQIAYTNSTQSDETIGITMSPPTFSCPGYGYSQPAPPDAVWSQIYYLDGPNAGQPDTTSTSTVSIAVPAAYAQGPDHMYAVCFASPTPFASDPVYGSGFVQVGGVTYETGILQSCGSVVVAPCTLTDVFNIDTQEVDASWASVGDPAGRDA